MALAPVTIPEWLRPWHGAGVWHLLADEAIASAVPSAAPAATRGGEAAAPVSQRHTAPAAPLATPRPQERPRPQAAAVAAKPQPAPVIRRAPAPGVAAALADPAQWPRQWQTLFAKANPAPVLWTYHELGLDLSGAGEPARGALFRRLLSDLRLPKGTSAFWPTAAPAEGSDGSTSGVANADVFWAGVALLKPRVLVVFGATSLQDMGLEAAAFPLFQQQIFEGKLIVHVPDMSHLLAHESHLSPALSLLQAVLHSFTNS